jgi:hypothetical protein
VLPLDDEEPDELLDLLLLDELLDVESFEPQLMDVLFPDELLVAAGVRLVSAGAL